MRSETSAGHSKTSASMFQKPAPAFGIPAPPRKGAATRSETPTSQPRMAVFPVMQANPARFRAAVGFPDIDAAPERGAADVSNTDAGG
jgi:hypothetical protein